MRPPPALHLRATACAGECAARPSSHHRKGATVVAEIHDLITGDGNSLTDCVRRNASVVFDHRLPDRNVSARNSRDARKRRETGADAVRAAHPGYRGSRYHRPTIYHSTCRYVPLEFHRPDVTLPRPLAYRTEE